MFHYEIFPQGSSLLDQIQNRKKHRSTHALKYQAWHGRIAPFAIQRNNRMQKLEK